MSILESRRRAALSSARAKFMARKRIRDYDRGSKGVPRSNPIGFLVDESCFRFHDVEGHGLDKFTSVRPASDWKKKWGLTPFWR